MPFSFLSNRSAIAFAFIFTLLSYPLAARELAADETVAPAETSSPPGGAVLNATDAELDGILSPKDRANTAERWEKEIANLERLDRTEPDPDNAVMLLGSSSIRLWDDAAKLLTPYPVIRRGYGGARFSDLVVFARRLLSPHDYRALVVFVGNDIAGSKQDRPVEEVRKMVSYVVAVAREHQPDALILLVEVTPTPARFGVWPEIRSLNAMLREFSLTTPNVYFVPTAESYLTVDDQPREDLFREDRLHQNDAGYRVWAGLIRDRLNVVLDASVPPKK